MAEKSEEIIFLRRAREGDFAAFGELIRKYQSLVYAVALPIVSDPSAAEDVTQDTFVSAFQSLKDLRSDDSFPAWLHSIARNRALARLRERNRITPLEKAGMLPSSPLPSREEIEGEAKEARAFEAGIRQVLCSLSDALRFPVLLCYLGDMPTAEAARFLGIKEGTLRKRLHDGKKKLQERIVKMAERSLREYRLPPGFYRRCICGCERAQGGQEPQESQRGQVGSRAAGAGLKTSGPRPFPFLRVKIVFPLRPPLPSRSLLGTSPCRRLYSERLNKVVIARSEATRQSH